MNQPNTPTHPKVAIWLAHIKAFSVDIGARGPTTENERKAADYARQHFESLGLSPKCETFKSARSIFHPHLIGSLLMLFAFVIYPLGGRLTAVIAALISLGVLVSELLELGFVDNPLRRLVPKGESQNVYASITPRGEHLQDLVLVGHLDTQRTPLVFRSPGWVKIYDRFTMVVFITFIWQVLIYGISLFVPLGWAWYATIPSAISAVLLAALCLQAETTPFTAGANDNATAAGMVLTLAETLKREPLEHTRVLAVCTGCEEVQHYGMIDWYRRHRSELVKPKAIIFEMLGVAGPAWLEKEGIIVPFKADPDLLAQAQALSMAHPEWGAYPVSISGGNTEMADAVRARVPAITFFGLTRDGIAPYWHQVHDTYDKMNPQVMQNTWALVNAFIQSIDADIEGIADPQHP